MPFKAQNIFKSRDPFVEEPLKTDMTDFTFRQRFLICIEDKPPRIGVNPFVCRF
jgi:hypothetical protein